MTYPIGAIILIRGYKLPTEEKDKFFIVIDQQGDDYNLLSMTTSQFYFSPDFIKKGIINKDSGAAMYCFEANRVIGEKGFCFLKHTFINLNSNIHTFSFETLNVYKVEWKDQLLREELENLIYSFYQYKGTSKRHKEMLEKVLHKICR